MNTDLEERLAAYRPVLETAIERHEQGTERRGGRRGVWVTVAAVLVAGAAVAGWLVVDRPAHDRPLRPADATVPVATIEDPVVTVAVAPPPTTTPVTTPAPNPAPTASTTNAAAVPPLAIGDSVMLGAADELAAGGIVIDAEVSRQMGPMIPIVQGLRETGAFGDVVIVHLGNNGSLSGQVVDDFFTALSGVPRVIVLTDRAPREYVAANNATLAILPARYPNVTVLDWAGLADHCPGVCFYDDGIHLRQDGQTYYAQLIVDQLGL